MIEAAVAAEPGVLRFFDIQDTGLSTASQEIAEHHRAQGWPVREVMVTSITLDDILGLADNRVVHWLKIDVEGFERQVLEGWRSTVLPWVVVVESTYPNSQTETHETWDPLLLDKGYVLAYRDGLNRFYLSPEHAELTAAFRFGPNVFDGFQLSEGNWAVAALRKRWQNAQQAIEEEKHKIVRKLEDALQQTERERAEATDRKQQLMRLVEQTTAKARDEAERHLRELLDREQHFAAQLADLQAQAQQALTDAQQAHERREARLLQELAASCQALEAMRSEAEAREQALRSESERQMQALREQAEARLEAAQAQWKARQDALIAKLTAYAAYTQALAQRIQVMQSTFWWRLSMPFRRASRWEP
ncbi:MAG: FkbM family methyltransferase, partial [Halothiobacillaceae bacterium]